MSNWLQAMPTAEAYEMNKVLFDLHHKPDDLDAFRVDPVRYLGRFPLTVVVRDAILNKDVADLYLAGANPYLLRAHCIGMKIPEQVSVGALKRLARER